MKLKRPYSRTDLERTPYFGKKLLFEVLNSFFINGSLALITGSALFFTGLNMPWENAKFVFLVALPLSLPLYYFISISAIYYIWKPTRNFFWKPKAQLTDQDIAQAYAQVVNLPLSTFLRACFVSFSVICSSILIFMYIIQKLGYAYFTVWDYASCGILMLIIVLVHATFDYYFVKNATRNYVPFVGSFLKKPEDCVPYLWKFKLRNILFFVFSYTILVPLVVLSAVLLGKAALAFNNFGDDTINYWITTISAYTITYLVILIFLSIFIIFIMSREFSEPISTFIKKMDKIEKGDYKPIVDVSPITELRRLFSGLNSLASGLKEKEVITDVFGKHVPDQKILDKILKEKITLDGAEKFITVLFCDIRNFTQFSESIKPDELVRKLNAFLTDVGKIIQKNKGIVDKYLGDAVIGLFGSIDVDTKQADHALQAAIEIQELLSRKFEEQGIEAGIGIHSGFVLIGNIGSSERLEYTAVGDALDVASEVQNYTKETKSKILISENTFETLKKSFDLKERGVFRYKDALAFKVYEVER